MSQCVTPPDTDTDAVLNTGYSVTIFLRGPIKTEKR